MRTNVTQVSRIINSTRSCGDLHGQFASMDNRFILCFARKRHGNDNILHHLHWDSRVSLQHRLVQSTYSCRWRSCHQKIWSGNSTRIAFDCFPTCPLENHQCCKQESGWSIVQTVLPMNVIQDDLERGNTAIILVDNYSMKRKTPGMRWQELHNFFNASWLSPMLISLHREEAYAGHYIFLVSYNKSDDTFDYLDPGFAGGTDGPLSCIIDFNLKEYTQRLHANILFFFYRNPIGVVRSVRNRTISSRDRLWHHHDRFLRPLERFHHVYLSRDTLATTTCHLIFSY